MPIANINGVNLNYDSVGQGEAIVLIHGYTGSSQDWTSQIKVLSPKYKVIALDIRGHGKSAAPPREDEYSIEIFVNDTFSLLQMLNIKKCCLVGHSLGGFIALQFALEHQDMLAALVLVGTSGGQITRAPNYDELRQKLSELARSQGMEAAFEYDAANNPMRVERFQKHPELREITRQKMLATSVDGYVYIANAMGKREPVTSRLPEIKVPTVIYWGDEDLAMADSVQTLKDGIAGSELITVHEVGHSPHEESPDLFNNILLEFLGRINW
ncbi:alpha/beta fold hydrolase [Chloroflexota bacterium]